MKNSMTKWLSAIALISCVACSKAEIDTEKAISTNEKGVYGYLTPFIEEGVGTRGDVLPDQTWKYVWEVGDKINIWSEEGTTLFYAVSETSGDRATFTGGGFDITDGKTYYSFHPRILSEEYQALPVTFEGQIQNGNDSGKHLANYIYSYTSAVCTNGNISFQYHNLVDFLRFVITLPKEGLTITKLTITADKQVFALNGTTDVTAAEGTGSITPTSTTDHMTLTLNNVQVTGKVLKAFMASVPLSVAANYIISVEDSAGKVYTSSEISKGVYGPGAGVRFQVDVESEEREYELVTSMPSDPAGKYILVYPVDGKYRAFSFAKTMENAETAAASVSNTAFAELYDQASTLYNTVIGGNYVEITGEANATTLTLNPEQEAELALNIAANSNPWTVTSPAKDLQTTLTSGSYTMKVDHLVANVASDGKADLVAAFNAPDAVAIMTALRGHDVNVTFDQLIDLAIAKTTTTSFSSIEKEGLKMAFEKMCRIAKDVVPNHPEIFGAGSTLMDIDRTTNVFTVFSQYHDNVANLSWSINPQKRFGLANLGYNVNVPGFTFSVNMPSSEWFTRLNASIKAAGSFDYSTFSIKRNRDAFVNYWAAFDNNSQYDIKINGVKIENFYQRLAGRLFDEMDDTEFMGLYYMAQSNKITALGTSYNTLAGKLNTGIQPAYIYKKVVE